jgi:hypothetical protein
MAIHQSQENGIEVRIERAPPTGSLTTCSEELAKRENSAVRTRSCGREGEVEARKTGIQYESDGVFADLMQIDVRRQVAELWVRSNDECRLFLERQRGGVRIAE